MLVAAKADVVLVLEGVRDDAATAAVPEFSKTVAREIVKSDVFTVAVSDINRTPALERVGEDVATIVIPVGNEVDPGPCLS